MTAQRQERLTWPTIALLSAIAVVSIGLARAATTERLVADRFTGLAISGVDPVGYFTDARPLAGRPEFEAAASGAIWRFRNEGNRAVFLAHPEVYGPQFGGYDPIDIARGVAVAGDPRLWLIAGQRLFLFGRQESRAAFAADPGRLAAEARRRWPALRETLAR